MVRSSVEDLGSRKPRLEEGIGIVNREKDSIEVRQGDA